MFKRNKRGQNVAEYSILIALVVAAAVAMQTYVKRSVQARIKDAADARDDGSLDGLNFTWKSSQYEPYYVNSSANVSSTRTLGEDTVSLGALNRTDVKEITQKENGAYENTKVPEKDKYSE